MSRPGEDLTKLKKIANAKEAAAQKCYREFARQRARYRELTTKEAEIRALLSGYAADMDTQSAAHRPAYLKMRQQFLQQLCEVQQQQHRVLQEQLQVTERLRNVQMEMFRQQRLFEGFVEKREAERKRELLKRQDKQQPSVRVSML
ncbi:MAG: hypothetical protein AAF529_10285 [Pseudomonadota bacterium]